MTTLGLKPGVANPWLTKPESQEHLVLPGLKLSLLQVPHLHLLEQGAVGLLQIQVELAHLVDALVIARDVGVDFTHPGSWLLFLKS